MKELIKSIMEQFKTVQWSWSKREVQSMVSSVASSLGYSLDEETENRISYGSTDTVDLTIYFSGDHAERVEITLASHLDMDELMLKERETKVDEYIRKYHEGVQVIGEALHHAPIFNGGPEDTGFPQDQEAIVCALWKWNHARLMFQVKQEDPDLPLRLCLVVEPDVE